MKAVILVALVALCRASPLVDEVVPNTDAPAPAAVDAQPALLSQDPSVLLSGPIDKATKLIAELDEHIRKYLPTDEIAVAVTTSLPSYNNNEFNEEELPAIADERQVAQVQAMITQVTGLADTIENTITDLVSRRRYVTAAMLRSMLSYVRRVNVNLERLQNRLQSVANVASVGAAQQPPNPQAGGAPAAGGVSGMQFIAPIRDRVNRITEEIGSIVSRIRGSFTPGATGAPLPALSVTSSPGAVVALDIQS
ncbi:hypothetical protein HDE_07368 [Halotydeus destructor]|nr:hypothetical protein HDE_07368 [Halotydeus destructor]